MASMSPGSGSHDRAVNAEIEDSAVDLTETLNPEPEVSDTPPKIETGFAVLIDVDGHVFVERDRNLFSMPVEREITLLEVRRYASEIIADLQAQAAAEYTVARLEALEAQKKNK
jgi:hypothetical protein